MAILGKKQKQRTVFRVVLHSVRVALALFLSCLTGQGQTLEYKFQAVYFFNFLQYTQWPEEKFPRPDAPVIIGVLGENPFGSALDEAVKDEVIQGRRVIVKYYRRAEEMDLCHALYICRSEERNIANILPRLGKESVLTVSDMNRFTERGGHIQFLSEKEKLRFAINLTELKNSRLKLSSQLLKLAKVRGREMEGKDF
ncbi:MAG: YfiR family protein [Verrucomicrobiales bacterium]|nr:YfiR family protein [Verrucomicrobiales bacterium]